MEKQNFMTVTEVAKKLGITRSRVIQKINDGSIPAKRTGNLFLINPKDIEGFYRVKVGKGFYLVKD